jgi:sulfate-transporting ATPase
VPYEGNYATFLDKKTERMRLEKKSDSKRQKELEKELEWIRASPKARQAKSKARVSSYEALLEDVRLFVVLIFEVWGLGFRKSARVF